MKLSEAWAIEALAQSVATRASGFAARGTSIFNGAIVAEELLDIALKIRGLCDLPKDSPDTTSQ
ncbi:hypothetical protein IVB46_40380 [Bradyrhizobium sp. 61]|uniref:hypothetical protein n=1 Tax=Bradyrhizobium sp. 61 TaxID=2782679 RepID=UPI001FF93F3E|nr:hypothetical protein [Bradyrhizobium sp. 61]MCK1281494.1 hypothetical protein [Bradyrhizobium sp. 61]